MVGNEEDDDDDKKYKEEDSGSFVCLSVGVDAK